jgi:hypothetical protein
MQPSWRKTSAAKIRTPKHTLNAQVFTLCGDPLWCDTIASLATFVACLFFHTLLYYFAHDSHTFSNYSMKRSSIGCTIRMAARSTKAIREHTTKL